MSGMTDQEQERLVEACREVLDDVGVALVPESLLPKLNAMRDALPNELRACPLCGSSATGVMEMFSNGVDVVLTGYQVACCSCGARGPGCVDRDPAIAAWNRRAGDDR